MADIELVIKIPEELYKANNRGLLADELWDLRVAIKNGTPLPKGHGKLKDIDKIISDGISKGFCDWYDEMKYAETIIEADKSESEKEE